MFSIFSCQENKTSVISNASSNKFHIQLPEKKDMDPVVFNFYIKNNDNISVIDGIKNSRLFRENPAILMNLLDTTTSHKNYNYKSSDDKEEKKLGEWRKKIGGSKEKNYWLDTNAKAFVVRRKNPIVVIDPGHGIKGGNEGAQARIYKYKLMGGDGKTMLDEKGNELTKIANVNDLPQYALDNTNDWICGDNAPTNKNHKYDPDRAEFQLTYDIAIEMVNILKSKDTK